jgi:hypothetical protein
MTAMATYARPLEIDRSVGAPEQVPGPQQAVLRLLSPEGPGPSRTEQPVAGAPSREIRLHRDLASRISAPMEFSGFVGGSGGRGLFPALTRARSAARWPTFTMGSSQEARSTLLAGHSTRPAHPRCRTQASRRWRRSGLAQLPKRSRAGGVRSSFELPNMSPASRRLQGLPTTSSVPCKHSVFDLLRRPRSDRRSTF